MKTFPAAIALVALPPSAFAAASERDVLSSYADLAHAVLAAKPIRTLPRRAAATPSAQR